MGFLLFWKKKKNVTEPETASSAQTTHAQADKPVHSLRPARTAEQDTTDKVHSTSHPELNNAAPDDPGADSDENRSPSVQPDSHLGQDDAPSVPSTAQPQKKRRRRKKAVPAIAYIDTEFNAFDYYGQNGGHQEIIQIGIVIMKGGEQTDGFQTFCALKRGHVLSRRTVKLTGIGREDLEDAPAFPEALAMMNDFLDRHRPLHIYAYGSEDRQQMLNTARMYNIRKDALRYAEAIEDNMKMLSSSLGLKKNSSLTLSVRDLCEICGVNPDRQHDAFNDAAYLAMCSELIRRSAFDRENVDALLERKSWASNYRIARRIREQSERICLADEDLEPIHDMIEQLKEDGQYPRYQLQALYDDLLMVSGRLPENEI